MPRSIQDISPSPTTSNLHAHWDCSYGVSGASMLAACLDTISREEAQCQLIKVERLIQNSLLENIVKTKISLQLQRSKKAMRVKITHTRESEESPSLASENKRYRMGTDSNGSNGVCDIKSTATATELIERVDTTATTVVAATKATTETTATAVTTAPKTPTEKKERRAKIETRPAAATPTTATVTMERLDGTPQANRLAIQHMLEKADRDIIPSYVSEKSIEVFHEIEKAELNLRQTETTMHSVNFQYGLDMVVEVVGTILSLYSLGVQTVSCSNIPLGSTALDGQSPSIQPQPVIMALLIGLPIFWVPPTIALGEDSITITGAALLRVLTGVSRTSSSATTPVNQRPAAMVLRAVGFGLSDISQQFVRLTVGEVQRGVEERMESNTLRPSVTLRVEAGVVYNSNSYNRENESSLPQSGGVHQQQRQQQQLQQPESLSPTVNLNHDDSLLQSLHWNVSRYRHVQANLNDTSPEQLAFVLDLLVKNGAIDTWVTPIMMHGGRLAHTLHCLCLYNGENGNDNQDDASNHNNKHGNTGHQGAVGNTSICNAEHVKNIIEIIFLQTSAVSIQIYENLAQFALPCSILKVQLPYGTRSPTAMVSTTNNTTMINTSNDFDTNEAYQESVDVKVICLGNSITSIKPEFDQCREISLSRGIPIQQVMQDAVQAVHEHFTQNSSHVGNNISSN